MVLIKNNQENDEQLIIDYLNGDNEAFSELVKDYLKPIYNFIFRLTKNTQESEDITQETFLKVWKNIKKYRKGENFKTWIFTIARNTTIDWLRKKKNLTFSDFENKDGSNTFEENITDPEPLSDELIAIIEDKKLIEDLLKQLSPLYQEILFLHYNEQLTFSDMGKILNKSTDTVKSQHRRALIMLRKIIDKQKIQKIIN
ncbi:MAG: RNA polymerase sigma factor [Candidatus Paceibacterota bacterium]